jgi:hypothetical protein
MNTVAIDYGEWEGTERGWTRISIVAKLDDVSKNRDILANKITLLKIPHFSPVAWKGLMESEEAAFTCWRILGAVITSGGSDIEATCTH